MWCCRKRDVKFSKQVLYPSEFSGNRSNITILCFCRRAGNSSLFSRTPRDGIGAKENNKSRNGGPIITILSPVSIGVGNQLKGLRSTQEKTMVDGVLEIAK